MPPFPFLFETVEIGETTATDSALVSLKVIHILLMKAWLLFQLKEPLH